MFGRRQIFTDEAEITAGNVCDVLNKALYWHSINQEEINYLWGYYRGVTPILNKTKEVRETINHKIAVNRANEIVTFKRGYGFGEPIQYIRRGPKKSAKKPQGLQKLLSKLKPQKGGEDKLSEDINRLNEFMFTEDKHAEDSALAEWLYVCGVGMRMALPGDGAEEPFKIYTLDPRYSFVVRYNGLGEPVVMGVKIIQKENGAKIYSVYTRDRYFEIENDTVLKEQGHVLRDVPLFEYPANKARLGAFEIALPLLDAINEIESNRLDDVVQYVNSFLALLGGTIDDETAKKLNEYKMLCLPEGVDAKYLSVAMQQTDVQVMADSLYEYVLTICGIPNRNGGSSTSDTGSAVIMRDGWEMAEAHMKSVEQEFKKAEKRFLKLILRILKDTPGIEMGLELKNVEIKFSRRNYDNLQTKAQVLTTLLNNPKIHPQLAFVHSGMFLDPESAYLQSKEWWEEQEEKQAAEMNSYVKSLGDNGDGDEDDDTVQQDRQDDSVSE